MTLCLLVRHAAHDLLGRVLVGRAPGVPLNAAGRRQANELGAVLQKFNPRKVQSSPRQRAMETASAVATQSGLDVEVCRELDEMDFGAWTGKSFDALEHDAEWERWNSTRSAARPPGGESMAEAEARVLSHLRSMRSREPQDCVVMVTHAEVIRAAALHCMGMSLDAWAQLDFAPGAVVHVHWRRQDLRPLLQITGGMAAA